MKFITLVSLGVDRKFLVFLSKLPTCIILRIMHFLNKKLYKRM